MRTLYLLRHAKSSRADPRITDQERPLALTGRWDAKRIAKHLVRLGIELSSVLCSSAERTRATLELVRPALGANATVSSRRSTPPLPIGCSGACAPYRRR
jgi:phosphohistidine phosphatase